MFQMNKANVFYSVKTSHCHSILQENNWLHPIPDISLTTHHHCSEQNSSTEDRRQTLRDHAKQLDSCSEVDICWLGALTWN